MITDCVLVTRLLARKESEWRGVMTAIGYSLLGLNLSNLSLALVRRQNSFPHCAADMPRQAAQNHQDRILFGREKQGQAISQDQNPIRHSLSCRRDSSVQEIASWAAAISSNSNEIRIRPTHRSPFSSRKALKGRLDVSKWRKQLTHCPTRKLRHGWDGAALGSHVFFGTRPETVFAEKAPGTAIQIKKLL